MTRTSIFVAVAAFCIPAFAEAPASNPPNIVYLLADDLGYGDVHCFNPGGKIPTPNLDRLASEGMRFTDMHSGSAVCTPTRYGIMTGRYSWRSSLQKGVLIGLSPALIPPDRETVASFLKAHGYDTAGVGKWHLGLGWTYADNAVNYSVPIEGGPAVLGFNSYFGIPASLDMAPYLFFQNDRVVEAPTATVEDRSKPKLYWRGGPIAPSFKHQDVQPTITRVAIERIEEHAKNASDKPLFLYVPFAAPHTPILPSEGAKGRTGLGDYGDFVCDVDDAVGKILAALEKAGMSENTLVFFTSDNGFAPYAGLDELRAKDHDPCPGLRGAKSDIFEGGHRIPFIARWPKHIPAGETRTTTAWLGDLFATAAEVVGEGVPEGAAPDSVSLLPVLLGKDAAPRAPIVHHSGDGYFAIRDGDWKLIFCAHSGGGSKPKPNDPGNKELPQRQLYNLAEDLGEQHNVAAEHPDIVERLTKEMAAYIDNGRSTPGPALRNDVAINWQRPE